MRELRRIETGLETRKIKPGDIVRFLQPFRPELYGSQEYAFGIVVGVIKDGSTRRRNHRLLQDCQVELDELVVYLYEPDSTATYIDQFGVEALFSFDSSEVEVCRTN